MLAALAGVGAAARVLSIVLGGSVLGGRSGLLAVERLVRGKDGPRSAAGFRVRLSLAGLRRTGVRLVNPDGRVVLG
jgi:hypothetical protein